MAMQIDSDDERIKLHGPFHSRRSFIFAVIGVAIVVDIAFAVMIFGWW